MPALCQSVSCLLCTFHIRIDIVYTMPDICFHDCFPTPYPGSNRRNILRHSQHHSTPVTMKCASPRATQLLYCLHPP